jgi:hypothetical protein
MLKPKKLVIQIQVWKDNRNKDNNLLTKVKTDPFYIQTRENI